MIPHRHLLGAGRALALRTGPRSARGLASAVLCWVLLIALFPGCPSKKEPERRRLVIDAVQVFDRSRSEDRVAGVTPEVVSGWIRTRLRACDAVELVPAPRRGAYQVRLELGVGPDEEGEGKLILVSARAAGSSHEADELALQASLARPLRGENAAAQVRSAVAGVVDDLAYQARLAVGPEADLVRALGDKDVHRVMAATEIAAVRKARPAVPALIALLEHKDERVSDRAIGALAAIGDARAVKPLTRLPKLSDTARMAKVLDAVGALGGKEAKDYLEFVATGHDDADIRNLAAEALARMKQRAE